MASTSPTWASRGPRDRDLGGVYYALPDGSSIVELAHPVLTPNGCGLSPDGTVLYVAETETARLWAFDIEAPGRLRKQAWPSPHGGRLVCGLPGFQRFDSLAVLENGDICVAHADDRLHDADRAGRPGRAVGADARTLPDQLCFGGADRRTAFITLSGRGQLATMAWPDPGLPAALRPLRRRRSSATADRRRSPAARCRVANHPTRSSAGSQAV